MIDTKLKPLYHELTFWIMLAMSLPGIVAVYAAAYDGVTTGSFDPGAFQSAFLALPIIAYLLTRQYPRGKAVEAAGVHAAAMEYETVSDDEIIDDPGDEFGGVSTGGSYDSVDRGSEVIDAQADH